MLLELFTQIDLDTRALFALVGITPPRRVRCHWLHHALRYRYYLRATRGRRLRRGVAFVYIDRFEAVQLAAEQDDPIIALDVSNHIRDTNRAARTLFPELDGAEGTHLETTLPRVANCLGSDDPMLKLQKNGQTRYYRVTDTRMARRKPVSVGLSCSPT